MGFFSFLFRSYVRVLFQDSLPRLSSRHNELCGARRTTLLDLPRTFTTGIQPFRMGYLRFAFWPTFTGMHPDCRGRKC